MEDFTILSLKHSCRPQTSILCFELPPKCPVCGRSLSDEPLESPPVRFPPILSNSSSHPYSIIIKPTRGTFLQDYQKGAHLHTGVTNSKGQLCHFNEEGIHYKTAPWKQCLVVPLLDKSDAILRESWDSRLNNFREGPEWYPERYVELERNCLDFVVAFLNHIDYNHCKRGVHSPVTRRTLVDDFVLPMTSRAARYITLLKHLRSKGFLLQLDAIS